MSSFKPPAPYTDVPAKMDDPSLLPTQPVSPVSPADGAGGAMGWNVADTAGARLYPNMRKFKNIKFFTAFFQLLQTIGLSRKKLPIFEKKVNIFLLKLKMNFQLYIDIYCSITFFHPSGKFIITSGLSRQKTEPSAIL